MKYGILPPYRPQTPYEPFMEHYGDIVVSIDNYGNCITGNE